MPRATAKPGERQGLLDNPTAMGAFGLLLTGTVGDHKPHEDKLQ